MSRIAVAGAGIAGLAGVCLLARRHDVTLFEPERGVGGPTNTVDVTVEGVTHPVDTGFLIGLFDWLGGRERAFRNVVLGAHRRSPAKP